MNELSVWLRAIRIRFLLASMIGVTNGLAISWLLFKQLDPFYAFLTYLGVASLHASVDLLNDYWDYVRGIDKVTKRTPFSGGTGVLPENLLRPASVYRAGILFLILGSLIGIYFVFVKGFVIAILLAFAVIAIYFYSTSIVNAGLGEFFVAVKGTMIVLGTFFVQTSAIMPEALYNGVIIGLLSSIVLFVNSFPDYEADKAKGRRTLVIILGRERAAKLFLALPAIIYTLIGIGITLNLTPLYCIISFASMPLIAKAYRTLRIYQEEQSLISAMRNVIIFSRVAGVLMAAGFVLASIT